MRNNKRRKEFMAYLEEKLLFSLMGFLQNILHLDSLLVQLSFLFLAPLIARFPHFIACRGSQ